MAAPSNCIRLRLPRSDTASGSAAQLASLRKWLENFGDVASAEVLSDTDGAVLQVTYFDARCALAAKEALGDDCSYAPQDGCRLLRLGKAALESAALADVSNITCTSEGDYEVEFFDTRVTVRVAAAQGAPGPERPGPCEFMAAASAPRGGPRYVSSLRLSELRWDDLLKGRERRRCLQLLYLPVALCAPGALAALLEAGGLSASVERLSVRPARHLGTAVLQARSAEGVLALARFFHGRQLGASTPVAVRFAEGQGHGEPLRVEKGRAASLESTACGSSEASEAEASPRCT